jgi:hypothetical protein
MTQLVGMGNADLRQWLLVPVPASVLTQKPEALSVVLKRTSDTANGAIYGNYETPWRKKVVPAIASCSWEKAFYGVENDQGLSDPRLDDHLAIRANNSSSDLSSEPGMQTGAYSIHLLVPNLAKGAFATQIVQASANAERNGKISECHFDNLPLGRSNELWLVRVRGSVENIKRCSLSFLCKEGNKVSSYESPWLPRTPQETNLDCSFPLAPAEFPGLLSSLEIKTVSKTPQDGALAPRSWALAIWRIKAERSLLDKGYQVF